MSMQRVVSFSERKNQNRLVPTVHSPLIFHVCQALDMKVQLAPEECRKTWNPKNSKRSKPKPTIPEVKSKMIHSFCQALNIEVMLLATTEDTGTLKPKPQPKKPLPIIRSVMVYEICQALEINTELNTSAEFPDFKLQKKIKRKEIIPVVQSEAIFKFCDV
ncbi:hypothetical protein TNCT_735771 [Trichonephila clavata]|uniref:Uncharacterized protein n=1 Tax=Trichonephila clavata TaxID=2740835 RepID=A0A8X6H5Q3_TRICU|nr:hypothetical protein TNCT_735771 [Trichonephila clavata]